MWFKSSQRSGGIAAVIAIANIMYFFIVATGVRGSTKYASIPVSQLLLYGAFVDVVPGLWAIVKGAWSTAIVLFSFAVFLFWTAAGLR